MYELLIDTSELLLVMPEWVRHRELEDFSASGYFRLGYNCAISKASGKLGDELLRLKIKAAIDQLHQP